METTPIEVLKMLKSKIDESRLNECNYVIETSDIEAINQALNNTFVRENVSEDFIINGSGLFHWNSSIKKEVKLKMIEWYNNLSSEEKEYVDDLRHEAAMEEYDSHCWEEL